MRGEKKLVRKIDLNANRLRNGKRERNEKKNRRGIHLKIDNIDESRWMNTHNHNHSRRCCLDHNQIANVVSVLHTSKLLRLLFTASTAAANPSETRLRATPKQFTNNEFRAKCSHTSFAYFLSFVLFGKGNFA